MPEYQITYSRAQDFGGAFHSANFGAEIRASAISRSLNRIDTSGDNIYVVFNGSGALSQADLDILQGSSYPSPIGGLIVVHDSTPEEQPQIPARLVFSEDPRKAVVDGVFGSAAASSLVRLDYSLPQPMHLQEAFAVWSGMKLGDCLQAIIIHPLSVGSLAASALQGAMEVNVGAALSPYYDPLAGATHIELWNSADDALLETIAITGKIGNMIQLAAGLAADRDTTIKCRARFGAFTPCRGAQGLLGGLHVLGSGTFHLQNPHSITSLLPAGMILSMRLRTSAETGTREVAGNFIFRTPS